MTNSNDFRKFLWYTVTIRGLMDILARKAEIWHSFGTAMRMTWKYVYGIFIVSVSRLIRIKKRVRDL